MLSSHINGDNNEAPLFIEEEPIGKVSDTLVNISETEATMAEIVSEIEANKENLPPLLPSNIIQKKRLGKQALRKALIESEKLKRSTVIAPPVHSPSNSLSSVSAYLQKQKTAQTVKSAKKSFAVVDIRSKPWAKHISQEELDRILAKMPRLSHDDAIKGDQSTKKDQGMVVIKTLQCGRSDASKERIKAGILPKPTRNSLLELNRKLETKIKEQSSEAWKERVKQLQRPKKSKDEDAEEMEQVTDEEEGELMPKLDRQEIAQELLMPTEEALSTCDEIDREEENRAEELLDTLLDEATQNVESDVQRQQKSIMGFLYKDAPISDIPLFYQEPNTETEEHENKLGKVTDLELKRKKKIKTYFFDEEAQTDDSSSSGNDEREGKKKKKRRKDSDDESIDEAEIERELKASKFLVDEVDEEQNGDQIRATHTKLQLEADRAQIEKLAKKFNLSSESEYEQEKDASELEDVKESIWAGKIVSSDPRMSEDQLTDSMSEESIVRSELEIDEDDRFQSSLRTEHRTALDDLLKLSSVMDLPDSSSRGRSKPAHSLLPSSRALIRDNAKRGGKSEN